MKLALFTDPHYCSREVTCKTRRPVLSYAKVQAAMEACRDADVVICLGDLVDNGGGAAENIAMTRALSTLIRGYGIPFYCLMGNHDCNLFTRDAFNLYTGDSYPPFSVRLGNRVLIFLDANYTDDGAPYRPGAVDWKNAYLPPDQLERLRQALADDGVETAYVFLHQNLDPEVQEHHILRNAADVRQLLAASGKVRTVFQGHYHPGHDTVVDGIAYHTLPAMCEGEGNYFEMVEL